MWNSELSSCLCYFLLKLTFCGRMEHKTFYYDSFATHLIILCSQLSCYPCPMILCIPLTGSLASPRVSPAHPKSAFRTHGFIQDTLFSFLYPFSSLSPLSWCPFSFMIYIHTRINMYMHTLMNTDTCIHTQAHIQTPLNLS